MKKIDQRNYVDEPTYWPKGFKKWNALSLLNISIYFATCVLVLILIPNKIFDPSIKHITMVIGALGVWRYSWWLTHAIRAFIYGRIVFPKIRKKADKIWQDGWRPNHLHFMMTTFREQRDISEKVVRSILLEIQNSGAPGTIWLGSADLYDEEIIANIVRREGRGLNVTLRIIRQNVPGKRAAIGLVLRAMCRSSVRENDLVVFMDGDFILAEGAISRCMPLFKYDEKLQACTTDEEVICIGPKWIEKWLKMRFAQRRLAMQSHALSDRVLTLTGRMSVFRASHLLKLEFIRLLEADHLNHWLWGNFRFLSGDDKSTWYYMLKNQAHMLYVPDALGYTVEIIDGSGVERMVANFRRWSGNMLRNGARAIALGPKQMPFFIWWCLIDQRLSMWTMLFSPVLALLGTFIIGGSYFLSYLIFIAISRMLLSLFLFGYARKIEMSFPWILYMNQLINASVKVYCVFRLSKQTWANRGGQTSQNNGSRGLKIFQHYMAIWCTSVAVMLLVIVTLHYSGLTSLPSMVLFSDFFQFN